MVENLRSREAARVRSGLRAPCADQPWSCDETPPALFYVGLEQFNRGEYFEQHESLEAIWLADQRPLRRLYQGILKIGVGFYKLRLGNYRGTVNHINGGIAYLQRFEDGCLGVEIARLIREAGEVRDRAVQLGPERLGEIDTSAMPKVHYVRRG